MNYLLNYLRLSIRIDNSSVPRPLKATLLMLLLCPMFFHSVFASSIPFVDNLCYVRTESTKIKVSTSFNPNYLSFDDKLLFNLPSSTVKISKQLTSTDLIKSIEYLEHENLVTGYVNLPYLIQQNLTGTTSYYTMDNGSYSGGWVGSVYIKNPDKIAGDAVFTEDSRSNVGTKYVPRPGEDRSWTRKYENVKTHGLIKSYVWTYPTSVTIQQFISQGFVVNTYNQNSAVISNATTTIYWDNVNKVFTVENNDDQGALISRIIRKFSYQTVFDTYVVESFTIEQYNTFDSGDCYQEVIETTYTQYETTCGADVLYRSSNETDSMEVLSLESYPNPTTDVINVALPENSSGVLNIYNSQGVSVHMRNIDKEPLLQLNVQNYPEGMYLVRFVSDDQIEFQSKFIKQ